MSDASNQIIIIWKDVEARLSRHKLSYDQVELESSNLYKVRDSYLLWYLATYDSLHSDGDIPSSLNMSWIHHLCSIDVKLVAESLKECDSLLLRNECNSYDDLKHRLRDSYPFIGRLLSPMKQIIVQWFDNQSIPHFSLFHSWLSFFSRVNLSLPSLEAKALEDYLLIEENLQVDGFTTEEASLITRLFPRDEGYHFRSMIQPQHGNGSTADAGKHMVDKYLSFSDDIRLRYLGEGFAPPRVQVDNLLRRCRLVFVPKSMTGYRSISMEPSSLMWYQQGILRALVRYIHKHKELRRRFVPEDQKPNRDLAWLGSIDGSFATIDLSSASDSVAWPMVAKWFRETFLYKWMLCTRSTGVLLPDCTEMRLKKYAPMGSALCFPIECIVFLAITECAIRECGGNPIASRYRIYGDDIVVESEYAQAVIQRLEANGFTVNRRKTFLETSPEFTFRESCGGEFLNGADVTPVRLSRKFAGLSLRGRKPSQIEAIIELANDCFSQYPSVRRRCIESLLSLPVAQRPLFDSDGSRGCFSTQPTNWHLPPLAWSHPYQHWYLTHGSSAMKKEPALGDEIEDIRLFEYLRQADGRQRLLYPEDRIDVDLRRQIAGIWTVTSSPAEGVPPSMEITKTP